MTNVIKRTVVALAVAFVAASLPGAPARAQDQDDSALREAAAYSSLAMIEDSAPRGIEEDMSPDAREEYQALQKEIAPLAVEFNAAVEEEEQANQEYEEYYELPFEEQDAPGQPLDGDEAFDRAGEAADEQDDLAEQAVSIYEEMQEYEYAAESDPYVAPDPDAAADEDDSAAPVGTPSSAPVSSPTPDPSGGFVNPLPLVLLAAVGVGIAAVMMRGRSVTGGRLERLRTALKPSQPSADGASEADGGSPSMAAWSDAPTERVKPDAGPVGDGRTVRRRDPEDVPLPDTDVTPGKDTPPEPTVPDTQPIAPPEPIVPIVPVAPARNRTTPQTPRPKDAVPNSADAAPRSKKEMTDEERDTLRRLPELLRERVIGQDHAAQALGEAVQVQLGGRFGGERPVSILMAGTTGVGKTETAKALADVLYGGESSMVRLDMSEYMDKHNASRLVGAAPGYVGYEAGGQLTGPMSEDGRRVVLFDEIEKADPAVLNYLLQILDDGRLTSSKGDTVSFADAVVVLTSNLGSEEIRAHYEVAGIDAPPIEERRIKELLREKGMRPELVARMGDVVTFRPLREQDVQAIARLLTAKTSKQFAAEHSATLTVSDEAIEWISQKGYEPENGARPLRGVIRRHVETPVTHALLAGRITPGMTVRIEVAEDGDSLTVATGTPKPTAPKRRPKPVPDDEIQDW